MALQRQSAQDNQFLSSETKESFVAPGLTIEGKIEGAGNVRIAGRFKGEINVKGDVIIEQGAHVSGEIRAENIFISGEIEGNIHAESRAELLEPGVLMGDLKASSLTVAAGSHMRGKVDFGWEERGADNVVPIEGSGSSL
ncbi:MAG: polymer-forming cytoskeletal protein [Desulfatiglandales bacterium]